MKYIVVDFETANSDPSSICQVGIVKYENGTYTTLMDELIDPIAQFTNTHIHGIAETDVCECEHFNNIYYDLKDILQDEIVFSHNLSDKKMFEESCKSYNLPIFNIQWLNSATLVRRTWKQFANKGYGVEAMSEFLGINLNAHNAASDARATAEIIFEACKIKNYTIEKWVQELNNTVYRSHDNAVKARKYPKSIGGDILKAPDLEKVENKNNPFFGKKVVVSGIYKTWPNRDDLAKILKGMGADIDCSVSPKTNILCAGLGVGPSKLHKMQKNINEGLDAQIINEREILYYLYRKI